jgi:hypothetical protein
MERVILISECLGPAKLGRRDVRRGGGGCPPPRATLPAWALFAAAAAGRLAGRSEFDAEAERWGIEVRRFSREDLIVLIEGSTREIPAAEHRKLHQEAGDFVRWGRRGGLRTLVFYGRPYFSLLAMFRWGRVELEVLIEHRTGSLEGRGRCDPRSRV